MTKLAATLRWALHDATLPLFMLLLPRLHRVLFAAQADISPYARWGAKNSLRILGIDVTTEGLGVLDAGETFVFICNHCSWIDHLVLLAHLPHPVRFMVNRKYFRYPYLGAALRLHGYYAVDRGDPEGLRALLTEICQDLASGHSLVVFPEGTRSTSEQMLPFQRGAFHLAATSGRRVVPLFLYGTGSILSKGQPRLSIRSGPVHLSAGPPMEIGPEQKTVRGVSQIAADYVRAYESRRPSRGLRRAS